MWFQNSRYRSLDEVASLSRKIADHFENQSIDMVIGVETGGWLPAQIAADNLNVDLQTVVIGRNINTHRIYSLCRGPLHPIGAIWQGIEFLLRSPKLLQDVSLLENCTGKNILIVDDVAQSGRTLAVARACLKDKARSIKTAAISNVAGSGSVDFSILRGVHYFPWSKSSGEYEQYCSIRASGHS